MASKLEYLQRYMSSAPDAEGEKKKKRRKTAKKPLTGVGTRVVDVDHAWEQAAPSKDVIESKWELDAAEDEGPLVVAAAGEEVVDPQDLPVYVNSEAYLDELRAKEKQSQQDADGDLSPPRKSAAPRARARRSSSSDIASPPRRPHESKDDDASPPRKCALDARSRDKDDALPPRRKLQKEQRGREAEDDDVSPPRRRADRKTSASSAIERATPTASKTPDEVASPPRRSRRDASPKPREERKRRHSPSKSPSRQVDRKRRVDSMGRDIPMDRSSRSRRSASVHKRHAESSDQRSRSGRATRSGSRGRGRRDSSASSPPRRGRGRRSPSRSRERARSPSPRSKRGQRSRSPRKSTRWGSPRRTSSKRERSRSRSRSDGQQCRGFRADPVAVKKSNRDVKPLKQETKEAKEAKKMETKETKPRAKEAEEEKKAGLFTAAEFDTQRKLAQKRKDLLHGADAKDMGANAETVYRDKRGRKLDMLNEMVRQQEVLEGKREREAREEYEWGTGEVQKRERLSQQQQLELMKQTPFARHEDDEELERKRRERVRAFDPMQSKVFQEDELFGGDADGKKSSKKKRKSKKDTKSKPKYAGPPAPPNRFGIPPGYRWDGVVRGTGWEEKLLLRQNASTAGDEEAYKYAVADM